MNKTSVCSDGHRPGLWLRAICLAALLAVCVGCAAPPTAAPVTQWSALNSERTGYGYRATEDRTGMRCAASP